MNLPAASYGVSKGKAKIMHIYYQNDLFGKEIADSLARYVCYCLGENHIEKIELGMNSEKILNNTSNNHILIFTNLARDIKYWGIVIGKISKKIKGKKWKLRIIDLTWADEFPILSEPEEVIVSINECLDWLFRVTVVADANEVEIRTTDDYFQRYYDSKPHP
jgi:hypothetical protein